MSISSKHKCLNACVYGTAGSVRRPQSTLDANNKAVLNSAHMYIGSPSYRTPIACTPHTFSNLHVYAFVCRRNTLFSAFFVVMSSAQKINNDFFFLNNFEMNLILLHVSRFGRKKKTRQNAFLYLQQTTHGSSD